MIAITRKQVREVDRIAIEKYHIPGIVLMENAARGAADIAIEMLGPPSSQQVVISCGMGNNGGDGLALARHLHNRGYRVHIDCINPTKFTGDALINWRIISTMKLPFSVNNNAFVTIPKPNLIIDAIFGTGLSESPRPPFDQVVDQIHGTQSPILAIDLPSGLDCDSGKPLGACIRATRTVTFVAQKIGFQNPDSKQFTGEVTVADIGCPREAIDEAIKLHP
jgi:hydroxyethylthiazole kinase-like uncharacterized protein yjeF